MFKNLFQSNQKNSYKFIFQAIFKRIDFELKKEFKVENIDIKWCRGQREKSTLKYGHIPSFAINSINDSQGSVQGRVSFKDCSLDMQVTLHRNKKDLIFSKKTYKFHIESINPSNGSAKLLATAELNLADLAEVNSCSHNLSIELIPKSKSVLAGKMTLELKIKLEKIGYENDLDIISTWSHEETGIEGRESDELSLINTIKENRNDIVIHKASEYDSIGALTNFTYLGFIFISEECENFQEIFEKLNFFYQSTNEKSIVEFFYVPTRSTATKLLKSVNTNPNEFPSIEPNSKLSSIIVEIFSIDEIPCLVVLDHEGARVVDRINGQHIINRFSTSPLKILEIWSPQENLKTSPIKFPIKIQRSMEQVKPETDDSSKIVIIEKPRGNTMIELEKFETLNKKLVKAASINEEKIQYLTSEVDDLKSKLQISSSMIGEHIENERTLSFDSKRLAAERDVRTMLMKRGIRGPTGKFWRRRYFKIVEGRICYYEDVDKLKGQISIKEILKISQVDVANQDKNHSTFNIYIPHRIYELQARDQEHMHQWMSAVNYLRENI